VFGGWSGQVINVFQQIYTVVAKRRWLIGCAFCSSSLFTNSNWFTFDGDRGINDRLAASVPPSSPDSEAISLNTENTDEALTGETTGGTESLRESASLANELAEVANDNDADATDGEKILCTEEDSQASEGPVDAKEDKTGGASKAANESVPDNALPESHHTDCRCADSSESGTEEDVEIDDEKKSETAMTNEWALWAGMIGWRTRFFCWWAMPLKQGRRTILTALLCYWGVWLLLHTRARTLFYHLTSSPSSHMDQCRLAAPDFGLFEL
jgi:hypothetical protein